MATLVSLVGGNPMPAYLSASTLLSNDRVDRVILVCSNGEGRSTWDSAVRIKEEIDPAFGNGNVTIYPVASAFDQQVLRDAADHVLSTLDGKVELDYTGGTHLMGAEFHEAVHRHYGARNGDAAGHLWYVQSEPTGDLRPDGGENLALQPPATFDIKVVARLHGLHVHPGALNVNCQKCGKLGNSPNLQKLFDCWRNGRDNHYNDNGSTPCWGPLLERLVCAVVAQSLPASWNCKLYSGPRCPRRGGCGEALHEADVVAVSGHRVIVFECMTGNDRPWDKLCKAAITARNLAGDLVRVAVVADLNEDDQNISDCWSRISRYGFPSRETVEVFDQSDITAWAMDCENNSKLQRFLGCTS